MSRTELNKVRTTMFEQNDFKEVATVPVQPTASLLTNLDSETVKAALPEEVRRGIDKRVKAFVAELKSVNPDTTEFDNIAREIREMGDKELMETTQTSSRLLDMRESPLSDKKVDSSSKVAKNLIDFRRVLDNLNPDKRKKLLGVIPFGDQVTDWKRRMESSRSHLDSILEELVTSETDIKLDNQALSAERERMREEARTLVKFLYMADSVQAHIGEYAQELEASNDPRADMVKSNLEVDAVTKGNDLRVHALAMAQNFKALELTIDSNEKLVKNLYRARTTTITALRGAVLMKNALNDQKNVSDQVKAVQDMTSNYLVAVSEDVKNNAADITRQSQGNALDIDKLRVAYQNIIEAANNAEQARIETLDNLKDQREQLETFVQDDGSEQKVLSRSGHGKLSI